MSYITYTNNGSATTTAISDAPHSVRLLWNHASSNGFNILRVRGMKQRYGASKGKTFLGVHYAKVSGYTQLDNPTKELYFGKKVNVGKANKGMQVLSTPRKLDIQESLESLDVLVGLVEKQNATGITGFLRRIFS